MNPSNMRKSCCECLFYKNGICEDFDGMYFLQERCRDEKCPDFIMKGEHSLTDILKILENL